MPGRLLFQLLCLLAGMGLLSHAKAAQPVPEATVKAAFVYNFVRFAEWPGDAFPSAQDPIRLCLYGNSEAFLTALGDIDGKLAQGRPVRIQKVGRPADFRGCHILAVGESELRQLPEALRAAQDAGALTVGEAEGFVDAGGGIGLVVENERVRFDVNLEAARRSNVKLSSQLLKLARRIVR